MNVGSRQLLDDAFVQQLLSFPTSTAAGLALEVPSLQLSVPEANQREPEWRWLEVPGLEHLLARLRSRGFEIWLDDYRPASGFDHHLEHPEIDVVKLDRSVLAQDPVVLQAAVERVHELGKRVLLECVEGDADHSLAKRCNVDLAQGFRYAPSLLIDAFDRFCHERQPSLPPHP